MKRIGLLVAFLALLCLQQREPSEVQIRTAFQAALDNPLHALLITGSPAGAATPMSRDSMRLLALRKLGCVPARPGAYVCDFFVALRAGDETVRRTISGYFLDGPGTLTFAREIGA